MTKKRTVRMCRKDIYSCLMFQFRQVQQDVVEFLMWLLDVLHKALNCPLVSSPNHNGSIVGKTHAFSFIGSPLRCSST